MIQIAFHKIDSVITFETLIERPGQDIVVKVDVTANHKVVMVMVMVMVCSDFGFSSDA